MNLKRLRHTLFVIFAISAIALTDFAAYSYYYYNAPGPLAERTTLLFRKGMGFRDIVDDMAEKGVIRNAWLFKILAVALGDARKFNAGEYNFSAAISPRLVMDMIAEGRVVVHKITVPEGLRVDQVVAILDNEPLLEGKVADGIREGTLLPQTYHYTYGDLRQDIINRMQTGMTTTLDEVWATRKPGLPFDTKEQAVALASIVEKETDIDSERGLVASVYINRLRKGMRLQSDPTTIYAIFRDKGPLGRALLTSDLAYDSPYNTYKYAGLPPGPIASPGRKSLEAVVNPPETSNLYFVATGNGGHNFSPTLSGHNSNVKEYRKQQKKQKPAEKTAKEPSKKERKKKS